MRKLLIESKVTKSLNEMKHRKKTLQYAFRLYLNIDGKRLIGKGGAEILDSIVRHRSITAAAEELGMSYRFVWNYLDRMKDRFGKPVIVTRRGGTLGTGRKGGGETILTPPVKALLKDYRTKEKLLHKALQATRLGRDAALTCLDQAN
jgi:molybdate transport system regulatory protein